MKTDLIAAYYTLARVDRHGVARVPFADRVAAAANAGFTGIGIQPGDYVRARDAGFSDTSMHAVLNRHGIGLTEVDGLAWWPNDGDGALTSEQDTSLRLAEQFGARHLIAPATMTGRLPPVDALAERFAAACDRAATSGQLVGLEFLPWTSIPDVGLAWEIVRLADRPNGGITVDFWHHCAGPGTDAMLRAVPGSRVVAVHFTDGARNLTLDPFSETMTGRRLPGEGEFPLTDLLRLLDEIGVESPFTVECVSLAHRHLDPTELAKVVYDTTRQAIDSART